MNIQFNDMKRKFSLIYIRFFLFINSCIVRTHFVICEILLLKFNEVKNITP